MTMKDLKSGELDEIAKQYVEDRKYITGLCTIESYIENYVRRCEQCGELFVDSDEEFSDVCKECYDEEHAYEYNEIDRDWEIVDRQYKERLDNGYEF